MHNVTSLRKKKEQFLVHGQPVLKKKKARRSPMYGPILDVIKLLTFLNTIQCYQTKAETYEAVCRQNGDLKAYVLSMERYELYFDKIEDRNSLCQAFVLATDFGKYFRYGDRASFLHCNQ